MPDDIQNVGVHVQKPLLVDVIIVSYNARSVLPACLDSLRQCAHDNLHFSTTVVDNDSSDGTREWIASEYPTVRVINSGYNAGFAVANNIALQSSTSEFILLLNPDTVMRPGVIEHLVSVAANDRQIGIIGCRLEQDNGEFDHAAKRGFPSQKEALKYFLSKDKSGAKQSAYLAPHVSEYGFDEVDAVNGALMLVRHEALDAVGLLDERYWMYGEDLDWCRRFKLGGWKVMYDGRVTVVHLKSALSGRLRNHKLNWHFHKSMAIFYHQYESSNNPVMNIIVYLGIFSRAGLLAAKYLFFNSPKTIQGSIRRILAS